MMTLECAEESHRYSRDDVLVFDDEAKASFTALESFVSVQNSASSAQCRARSRWARRKSWRARKSPNRSIRDRKR